MASFDYIMFVVAFVLFLLDASGKVSSNYRLYSLGWACLVLTLLI